MKITLREMHRRKSAVEAEINAALFFAGPVWPPPRPTRRSYNRLLNTLCEISDILDGKSEPNFVCEECGKPITNGQKYISTDDAGMFHSKCLHIEHSNRMETAKELRKSLNQRVMLVRSYLSSYRRKYWF